jgi:hypothetical protein
VELVEIQAVGLLVLQADRVKVLLVLVLANQRIPAGPGRRVLVQVEQAGLEVVADGQDLILHQVLHSRDLPVAAVVVAAQVTPVTQETQQSLEMPEMLEIQVVQVVSEEMEMLEILEALLHLVRQL